MLCIKLHPLKTKMQPSLNRNCTPYTVSIKIREPLIQSQERSARDFVPN